MKPKALSTMRKRGRPSLAEQAADPFSSENMSIGLCKKGLTFDEMLDRLIKSVENVDDPVERAKLEFKLAESFMPYVAKKRATESSEGDGSNKLVINIKNFTMDNLKKAVEDQVIDV